MLRKRVCGSGYQKKAVPDSITHGGTQGCNPSSSMERDTVKKIGNHHYKDETPVDFTLVRIR